MNLFLSSLRGVTGDVYDNNDDLTVRRIWGGGAAAAEGGEAVRRGGCDARRGQEPFGPTKEAKTGRDSDL